ncbi:hypothetical protein B7755_015495 [Streptomyces sp. NBS 14/10]|uniref:hypothetical protein n=1 Tax=Streptomyces sp. NBS 14/10 TaxID=1945643 RepID=UPI000B7F6C9B|nr:hypothetical protein [Streptomyces sp. NBS 14/10]KAK1179427.1 hypothetical protein B7755_015495 [Streptomyces sp. NBS 14/10]NUS87029.1 hypothetical protein [Streptomyces sp.]
MDISGSRTAAQHLPCQDCDLVTVPARQGLEAVDILRRVRDGVGPVLHDNACDTLGFVVPAGTAAGWDLPGSECAQTPGCGVRLSTGGAAGDGDEEGGGGTVSPPLTGTGWLVPPGDTYTGVTDPAELRAALGEAARLIEAVDRCQ